MPTYDAGYFRQRHALAARSAERVVQLVRRCFRPRTILDLGCATGIWLAEWERQGAVQVTGVDGPWVPESQLLIPLGRFWQCDLSERLPEKMPAHDLALCVEVLEHLPDERGRLAVNFLCSRANVILFSAAVPGQGGAGHVNERVQSYWWQIFEEEKFICFDVIRPSIWDDSEVNVIYKQNMLLYIRENTPEQRDALAMWGEGSVVRMPFELNRVHPDLFLLRSQAVRGRTWRQWSRRLQRALAGR